MTAINYLDRNALSVAQTVMEEEFHMTNADYGHIVSIFLIAYGLMHPIAGRIVDRLGCRKGLSLALVWWSIASVGHAFARGVTSFAAMRFALGCGESGNFPAAIKTVGEWFPAKERALATGIFNVGAGLGAIMAPPLIGGLILAFGWRAAFVATGTIGLLWLIPWLALSHKPENHPRITPEELAYIKAGQEEQQLCEESSSKGAASWREIFSRRELWAIMAARFLADPVWLFFAFWIPKYFKAERGFDLKEIAMFTWMPFLAADIGSVVGGWLSSNLVKRGYSTLTARKIAVVVFALMMPTAILAVHAKNWQLAILCLSAAAFGHQGWSANLLTLPADLFSKDTVASCYGLTAMMGVLGGALFEFGVGGVIDSVGYIPAFTVAGLLHPIGALVIATCITGKRHKQQAA